LGIAGGMKNCCSAIAESSTPFEEHEKD